MKRCNIYKKVQTYFYPNGAWVWHASRRSIKEAKIFVFKEREGKGEKYAIEEIKAYEVVIPLVVDEKGRWYRELMR